MKSLLTFAAVALVLAGCSHPPQRTVADECAAYGFTPGTEGFAIARCTSRRHARRAAKDVHGRRRGRNKLLLNRSGRDAAGARHTAGADFGENWIQTFPPISFQRHFVRVYGQRGGLPPFWGCCPATPILLSSSLISIFLRLRLPLHKRGGASCGRLCPMPPLISRCSYLAGEFLRIGAGVRVWRAIGITFEGDGGHGDDRDRGKPLFQIVVFRLAFGQTEPPAIVVDHDRDVIRDCRRPPRCDRTWRRRSPTSARRAAR